MFEFTPLLGPFQIHFGKQNHLKNDAKTGTVFREEKKRPILKKTRKKSTQGRVRPGLAWNGKSEKGRT